jgi:hypothetical protein
LLSFRRATEICEQEFRDYRQAPKRVAAAAEAAKAKGLTPIQALLEASQSKRSRKRKQAEAAEAEAKVPCCVVCACPAPWRSGWFCRCACPRCSACCLCVA